MLQLLCVPSQLRTDILAWICSRYNSYIEHHICPHLSKKVWYKYKLIPLPIFTCQFTVSTQMSAIPRQCQWDPKTQMFWLKVTWANFPIVLQSCMCFDGELVKDRKKKMSARMHIQSSLHYRMVYFTHTKNYNVGYVQTKSGGAAFRHSLVCGGMSPHGPCVTCWKPPLISMPMRRSCYVLCLLCY